MAETKRRVKLYALNAERQWDDKGTGYVTCTFVDRLKGVSLVVKAETDSALLLESKVQLDTAYQKQQETLIVWSEGENCDLALSFQEKTGCDEIWEMICQVQGKDPSVNITQDFMEESDDERFDDSNRRDRSPELPPCDPQRLETISEIISNSLASGIRREKLASLLETESYITKLLHAFHVCEKLGNLEGLHHLYDIFKNIFLLNKNALFEIMFADDAIFDVVGCLEYDPNNRSRRKHRDYLKEMSHFREVIPITNPELLAKIHQTYRVQYIQDVVFPAPSILEENMLSTLSSFIYFNKIEIVSLIQEDEKFLNDLFSQLTDEYIPLSKRRDLVLFLKEFVSFSHTLQPQNREIFFKTLTNFGVLPALEITLSANDHGTKSASIDILACVVEFSPSMVRDYMYQQATSAENEDFLINIIIEQMLCDSDPELGGAVQLSGILRLIIDPDNMLTSINKSEKTEFLNFFYKHSMHLLIAPLIANSKEDGPPNEEYHTVQLLGLVLELLSFCVEHHSYHIKNYISNCNRDLIRRVLVLMSSRHMFLALSALRFVRKVISLKDDFYIRHIIKGDLLAPVVQALLRNKGRYNLLDSAILDLFEFIRLEDIQSLYVYIIEAFGDDLGKIEYVQTFKSLQVRYDQNHDHIANRPRNSLLIEEVPTVLRGTRYRRELRSLDNEEGWTGSEDSENANKSESSLKKDSSPVYPSSSSDSDPELSPSRTPSDSPRETPRGPVTGSPGSLERKSPIHLKRALVDYEVCDSDEEETEGSGEREETESNQSEEKAEEMKAENKLKRIKIN